MLHIPEWETDNKCDRAEVPKGLQSECPRSVRGRGGKNHKREREGKEEEERHVSEWRGKQITSVTHVRRKESHESGGCRCQRDVSGVEGRHRE